MNKVKHNLNKSYLQSLTEEQRIMEMKEWSAEEQAQYLCQNGVMSIEEFRELGHKIIDEECDELGWCQRPKWRQHHNSFGYQSDL